VTGPATPATQQDPEPGPPRPAGQGIGRAAVLIAALTVLARVIGLARQLVFAHTVGSACLGTAYTTANLVPNVIYDIVLGGALTGIMVPLLARPAERSATSEDGGRQVSQISSALLTWTVAILLPAVVIIVLAAGPVISVLVPGSLHGCARAEVVSTGGRMLAVLAPQILLYGLAVVLYGILQAHRGFTAPALAPVLSSLVVIGAYLAFVPLGRLHTTQLTGLSTAAELTLAVGTTVGVAALVVTAMVPVWRLRLRLRLSLKFPPGVARRARGLAAVGILAVIAQDASVLVVTWLANGHGSTGAVVLYNYGWQVFTSAYAVLAIPIAVSAFPALSARYGEQFNDVAAGSTRAVLLMSWLGAAVLAGIAAPAARVFAGRVHGLTVSAAGHQAGELALAFALFAPGLVGYGLVACLFRVLLADGRNRIAATVVPAGWLVVIAVDLAAVPLVPRSAVVPVLALANTVGMAASGIALLVAVRRIRGRTALHGTPRAFTAGLAGALAGAAGGAVISAYLPASGTFQNGCVALLSCACVLAAFGAVAYGLDGGDLRAALTRIRRRVAG
jgi:putative peptidoglycan lipid II flippase